MSNYAKALDYEHILRKIVPAAGLVADPRSHGVIAGYTIKVHLAAEYLVNGKHAETVMTAIAEQLRIRAIRELGLEPILEAQRNEVRQTLEDNRILSAKVNRSREEIAKLREQVASLRDLLGFEDQ